MSSVVLMAYSSENFRNARPAQFFLTYLMYYSLTEIALSAIGLPQVTVICLLYILILYNSFLFFG